MEHVVRNRAVACPATSPASKGVGSLVALVIAVGTLTVAQLYVQATPKEPMAASAATLQRQPSKAVPTGGQSARGGVMAPTSLIRGLLLLEAGPHRLTAEQAKSIHARFYEGQMGFAADDPAMRRATYLKALAACILTREQKEFLEKEDREHYVPVGPAHASALESELQEISGAPPPNELMSLPDERLTKADEYMEPLIGHFERLQANSAIRLTPHQAARLLPIIHTYNATPSTYSALLLPYLTDEQKAYIDENLPKDIRITDDLYLGLEPRLINLLKRRAVEAPDKKLR